MKLPSAAIHDDTLDFSFSGLKTAVINYINNSKQRNEQFNDADVAASFTKCAVDSVVKKLELAIDKTGYETLVVAGGVTANSHLRLALEKMAKRKKIKLCMPELKLCGDNAAMIGAQCYYEFMNGVRSDLDLNAYATGTSSF